MVDTAPTVEQVRARAAELVEQGWTQDVAARDSAGHTVSVYGEEACEFCAIGAIVRAAWELSGRPATDEELDAVVDLVVDRIREDLPVGYGHAGGIVGFNDRGTRTAGEVASLLRGEATDA